MTKYWAIFKANLLISITYRSSLFLHNVGEFLDTIVFLFVWLIIFGEKQSIGGFTLNETITYLIGVGVITSLAQSWIQYDLPRDIKTGYLSTYLNKPLSYSAMKIIGGLADKPLESAVKLITYILVALILRGTFYINSNIFMWLLFVISIIFAYVINFLTGLIFGCYSFWFTENSGLLNIYRAVAAVFSGGYAPLTFFPLWFQTVGNILPFAYTRYFPMLIYLNKVSGWGIIKGIGIQSIWIVVLYFFARLLWRRGIKKYEGVGI